MIHSTGCNNPFQSTHPVRGGTVDTGRDRAGNDISIHPPREGWDLCKNISIRRAENFNPPTP